MTIQAVPAKLELPAEGRVSATVLVSNPSAARITNLRLRLASGGASTPKASLRPQGALTLGPGQVREYALSLGPWASPRAPSSLSLLATFTTTDPETGARTQQAVTASVELTAPAALEIEKLAGVEVKASLETLRSGQTEPVYLLVSNKSAQRLRVKEVIASHPDFIEIEQLDRNVTVAPGEVGLLRLEAEAEDEVEPGDHQLVFKLRSEIGSMTFDLVATEKTKVGVAGETEVLTVLGIPSLLLLPGFLVLATIGLFWRILRPNWLPKDFPLTLKEPEFWVLAVFISIVMVLLANPILDIDLLGRYGLNDLVKLWSVSMLIGLAIYLAILGAVWGWRSTRIPSGNDKPVDVLKKLGRRKLDLVRPRFSFDLGGGNAINLFVIEPESDARAATWTCPAINFTWSGEVDTSLSEKINQELDSGHDAGTLAGHLSKGEKEGKLTASFEGNRRPMEVSKDKVGPGTRVVMVGET